MGGWTVALTEAARRWFAVGVSVCRWIASNASCIGRVSLCPTLPVDFFWGATRGVHRGCRSRGTQTQDGRHECESRNRHPPHSHWYRNEVQLRAREQRSPGARRQRARRGAEAVPTHEHPPCDGRPYPEQRTTPRKYPPQIQHILIETRIQQATPGIQNTTIPVHRSFANAPSCTCFASSSRRASACRRSGPLC